MKPKKDTFLAVKEGLHPRNKNNSPYDFFSLTKQYPELNKYIFTNKYDKETIDFANPDAVKALNKVLLHQFYEIKDWDIPKDYLCPPIPGRADYIHHIADLMSSCNNSIVPQGRTISVLDIGVGANCIYPLIGNKEYGWRFVGSEIDPLAIASATNILSVNHFPAKSIEIRRQSDPDHLFHGIIEPNEYFDVTICNPPFHSSMEEATAGTKRKWKNVESAKKNKTVLNFGGKRHELVYPGGERAFVHKMIKDSAEFAKNIFWFTTLISKQSNLSFVYGELKNTNASTVRTIAMAQGQKKSRFIAWTFLNEKEQHDWREQRWVKE